MYHERVNSKIVVSKLWGMLESVCEDLIDNKKLAPGINKSRPLLAYA